MKNSKIVLINKIRHYRESLGLSQFDLGKLVGVSDEAISCFERGSFNPSLTTVCSLLKIFDCKFEQLFQVWSPVEIPDDLDFNSAE